MDYNLKVLIDGVELHEALDTSENDVSFPSISDVKLSGRTSMNGIEIGATASDSLIFTIHNPHKFNFDGAKVEYFISPASDPDEDEPESATYDEAEDYMLEDDEADDGEDATAEELAEIEMATEEETESSYLFMEGEEDSTLTTIEPGDSEWEPMGVFYAVSQTGEGDIRLTCMDGFCKMNAPYKPGIESGTVQDYYNDFRQQCQDKRGVSIDDYEFPTWANHAIEWGDMFTTYRDAMGFFAGLVGGYATFSLTEVCSISFYSHSGTIVTDDRIIGMKCDATDTVIEGMRCDTDVDELKDVYLESGTGYMIDFVNPFMTQEILDRLTSEIKGIRYAGGRIQAYWSEDISCGEFVRIMTTDEYEEYQDILDSIESNPDNVALKAEANAIGRVFLVNNQDVNFTGEAITTLESNLKTSTGSGAAVNPQQATFKRLFAEIIKAQTIDVDELFSRDIHATGTIEGATIISSYSKDTAKDVISIRQPGEGGGYKQWTRIQTYNEIPRQSGVVYVDASADVTIYFPYQHDHNDTAIIRVARGMSGSDALIYPEMRLQEGEKVAIQLPANADINMTITCGMLSNIIIEYKPFVIERRVVKISAASESIISSLLDDELLPRLDIRADGSVAVKSLTIDAHTSPVGTIIEKTLGTDGTCGTSWQNLLSLTEADGLTAGTWMITARLRSRTTLASDASGRLYMGKNNAGTVASVSSYGASGQYLTTAISEPFTIEDGDAIYMRGICSRSVETSGAYTHIKAIRIS